MTRIKATPPVCSSCQKTMRLILVRGTGRRKLGCMDCGQPDPMKSAETQRWLKGELGSDKYGRMT